ncbi:MAG: CRISPR-associated endonuclease/helicase Cas3 [Archaeoglobi archaeon]|nr:CRISPR-associated endonuclease/helicase Cas3 [Archaeoglobi archaeon]
MTELVSMLRAKSEGDKLLLRDHLLESLQRAIELKEFVEKNNLSKRCKDGDIFNDDFFESLAIAVFLHDLGKISYKFQKEVYGKDDFPKELDEFLRLTKRVKIRHELLSALWTCLLLSENDEWTKKIRTAVLLHHYNEFYIGEKDLAEIVFNYREDAEHYLEFLKEKWNELKQFLDELVKICSEELNDELIKKSLRRIDVSEERLNLLERLINEKGDLIEFAEFYEIDNENPDYEFIVFLGCLRRCDYSASGDVSIEITDKRLKDVFGEVESRIKTHIKKDPDWQKKALEKFKSIENAVLIAPTGSGKTEFALLWNSKLNKKLIYTLPLRVALNDLFRRFGEKYFEENFVDILHSTSFIEYLEEAKENKETSIDKKLTSAKLLSSPVLLTTPDQVFLTSLNYYGSDKVIAVYPMASVVIDEIQAYNPEMASIILKTLQIVKMLNGNVLVMTATLPPYFEPFLFGSDLIPRDYRLNFEKIDTANVEGVKNYNLKRHRIKIVNDYLADYNNKKEGPALKINNKELEEWIEKFEGKNIFVVVNNVSKAIEIYKHLKGKYSNIYLLHSRLIEKEKDRRIKEIKEKLKKGEKVIVVATQIIEASVDLDFDAMITEISPIDSQIQRWGRVYRNRDKDYSDPNPNVVIFIGKEENGKIKIDRGTRAIYDGRVVEKTIDILKKYKNETLSYEEERKMVDEVFNAEIEIENVDSEALNVLKKLNVRLEDGMTLRNIYVAEILKNLEFLKYFSVEKKSQAQRLFRNIAGIQILIPAIMKNIGDEKDREIAEAIEENGDITWSELEEKIRMNKWEIKKRLYQYSVNIPVFMLENTESPLKGEFKGFKILDVPEKDVEDLVEYGIDRNVLKSYEEDCIEDSII